MAHGDYDCCLICDCKMNYSHDARTKESVCTSCLHRMRHMGTIILTQDELIDFIKQKSDEESIKWLNEVGYRVCFYGNTADDYIITRFSQDNEHQWTLKQLPAPEAKEDGDDEKDEPR